MLIVFEGLDGSGKSTQYKLLCEALTQRGEEFISMSFPRYEEQSSALIKMYLAGEFGSDPDDVNAYAASSFYAVDRYASFKAHWKHDYDNGKLIILDRFTGSNAIHQGAKFNRSNRGKFFRWLEKYENVQLGLPKPDLTIYCRVQPGVAVKRIQLRGGKTDIHESDRYYVERCYYSAEGAAIFFDWTEVDASRSVEDIHKEVLDIVTRAIRGV